MERAEVGKRLGQSKAAGLARRSECKVVQFVRITSCVAIANLRKFSATVHIVIKSKKCVNYCFKVCRKVQAPRGSERASANRSGVLELLCGKDNPMSNSQPIAHAVACARRFLYYEVEPRCGVRPKWGPHPPYTKTTGIMSESGTKR